MSMTVVWREPLMQTAQIQSFACSCGPSLVRTSCLLTPALLPMSGGAPMRKKLICDVIFASR
jgi:hypothetical protein